MIKVDDILRKHCHITSDGQEDLHTSVESAKDAMEDFGKQLLEEASKGVWLEDRPQIRNTIKKVKF